MSRLRELTGHGRGSVYDLKEACLLGRGLECEVQISDSTVSRKHARISRLGEAYLIEDLGSVHGTLVNDRAVHRHRLAHRDVIRLGGARFVYEQRATGEITLQGAPHIEPRIVTSMDATSPMYGDGTTGPRIDELQRLTTRLKTVYAVSEAISNLLDLDELLAQILERLFDVFPGCDRGFLLLGPTEDALVPTAVKCRRTQDEALTVSGSIVHEVMSRRRAVLSFDAMQDLRFKGRASVTNLETHAFMAAPLLWRGKTLGLVYLDSKAWRAFTDADLELLVGLAGQAAAAVGVARLHDEVLRRDRLAQDLKIAERIQQSFLPRGVPSLPGYVFGVHYDPAHEVGGDFYDFIPLPEFRIGIAIGDVSGKGVSAALYMARLTRELRYLAAAETDPARVLARANGAVMENERDDMFVTLFYAVLDPVRRRLTFASAGHLPPLARRPAGRDVRLLDSVGGLPLGVVADPVYETGVVDLAPGDSVMLFTDGLVEAMNPSGVMYGMDRLLAIAGHGPSDARSFLDCIVRDMNAHVATAGQFDDTTIVCIGL